MKAIIIAGGLGTRLRPLTFNTPKTMVPVGNIPFILHQIELIKKFGISEIILNLHYLSDSIRELMDDEKRHGVKVQYSIEESPLGTAGAVKNAEQFFDSDPMLVFNGDILTDMDLSKLIKFHKKNGATATLTLTKVDDPTTYGLVITGKNGMIERFIEKPSWERVTANTINAGIYVIDPKVFKSVPAGVTYSFERELFPGLLKAGNPVFGYESDSYWMDIGNPSKYMQAHRAILEGEVKVAIPGREVEKGVWMGEKTKRGEGSKIFGPAIVGERCELGNESKLDGFSVLGDGVVLGDRSIVANSVIWDNVEIGEDVSLRNCVIGRGCRIGAGSDLSGGVVLSDGTVINKGSKLGVKL